MSESMIFCLGDGRYTKNGIGYQKNYRIFNQQVEVSEYYRINDLLPGIKLNFKDENGISISYQDAWANAWKIMAEEDKNKILSIPQFDADIFKAITGIEIIKPDVQVAETSKAREVVIDGVKYVPEEEL